MYAFSCTHALDCFKSLSLMLSHSQCITFLNWQCSPCLLLYQTLFDILTVWNNGYLVRTLHLCNSKRKLCEHKKASIILLSSSWHALKLIIMMLAHSSWEGESTRVVKKKSFCSCFNGEPCSTFCQRRCGLLIQKILPSASGRFLALNGIRCRVEWSGTGIKAKEE